METRLAKLSELRAYISKAHRDITLVLQSLQWDTDNVLQHQTLSSYSKPGGDSSERCLPSADDRLESVVTFDAEDISRIIESAARSDPRFNKGTWKAEHGAPNSEPDLRYMFTADERRAIYDSVVAQARFPSNSSLNLTNSLQTSRDIKSDASRGDMRQQIENLTDARDAKRRPTKYRVSNAAANYSHVLREVIRVQMTTFKHLDSHVAINETHKELNNFTSKSTHNDDRKCNKEDKKKNKRYAGNYDDDHAKHLQHHYSNEQRWKQSRYLETKQRKECQQRKPCDGQRHQ